jgi:transcriptional regulator with XRE-family HTH domain
MKTINDNIKDLRSKRKLTQEFVAKKLGVSRVWYNKLENNEIDVKVDFLAKIAEIFDVPVYELTQLNGTNYFSSNNANSTIKNIANVVNDNQELKHLYDSLIECKNIIIQEKEERLEMQKKIIESLNNEIVSLKKQS